MTMKNSLARAALRTVPAAAALVAFSANAAVDVLDFSGLQNNEAVLSYYSGGTGSLGSAGGPNYGIVFGSDTIACASQLQGGSCNTAEIPRRPGRQDRLLPHGPRRRDERGGRLRHRLLVLLLCHRLHRRRHRLRRPERHRQRARHAEPGPDADRRRSGLPGRVVLPVRSRRRQLRRHGALGELQRHRQLHRLRRHHHRLVERRRPAGRSGTRQHRPDDGRPGRGAGVARRRSAR